jgi:hypothetical protein
MRQGTPPMGWPRRLDASGQLLGGGERFWRRLPARKFLVNRLCRGAKSLEPFSKTATYCHLLPFSDREIVRMGSIRFIH